MSRHVIVVALVLLVTACTDEGGSVAPSFISMDEVMDPPASARPWVRWWWPGGDVDLPELDREVALLADAGFGGAEIQPFDAALDPQAPAEDMARRLSFDTPAFYERLQAALYAAGNRDLAVDLNLGTGWPTGGTHVRVGGSLRTLMFGEYVVDGPERVSIERLAPKKAPFYAAAEIAEAGFGEKLTRYLPEYAELLHVAAYEVSGGSRSGQALDLTDTVELAAESYVDLDDRVDAQGGLTWDAPAGRWTVVAVFVAPDGGYLTLPAQPEDGFIVDHLDASLVEANMDYFLGSRTGLPEFFGSPLRGFFNDSLEFKTERLTAADYLEEFEARRGYDLRPWLPAVFLPGADNFTLEAGQISRSPEFALGPEDERVRHDTALTTSELFIERFVATSTAWAEEHGLLSRAQPYGLDLDVIRAMGAASVPETEQLYAGGAEMFLRLASSGAHLYGRNLVSAESFVWMGRDFMTTPLKMKRAADKMFVAGVNHLVYHGFPYAQEGDFGVIGWTAFSSRYGGASTFSSSFSDHFAFWDVLPQINDYVARCQYLLRQGQPAADLLVYYPFLGFPTSLPLNEDHYEPLLGGYVDGVEPELRGLPMGELLALLGPPSTDPRSEWLARVWPVLDALAAAGYSWDWVNDERLATATVSEGGVAVGGLRYEGVLVLDTPAMPVATAETLASFSEAGGAVLFAGTTPARQPGFLDYESGDTAVVAAVAAAVGGARSGQRETLAELADALEMAGVAPSLSFGGATHLRHAARRTAEGLRIVFVRSLSEESSATTVGVRGGCADPYWIDPWEGAAYRAQPDDEGEVELPFLSAYGSLFLVCGDQAPRGLAPLPGPPAAAGTPLDLRPWAVHLQGELAEDATPVSLEALTDWREDEALRHAGAPALYRLGFTAPVGTEAWLELSQVHGPLTVRLNEEEVATLIVPPYRVDLSAKLREGNNSLELLYTPPLRNYLVGRAAAGDERYAQFVGKEDTLIATGIVGPALLHCEPGPCEVMIAQAGQL